MPGVQPTPVASPAASSWRKWAGRAAYSGFLFVVSGAVGNLIAPLPYRIDLSTMPPSVGNAAVRSYVKTIQAELIQASQERSQLTTLVRNVGGCYLGARQALPTITQIRDGRQAVVAAVEQIPAPDGARQIQSLFLGSFRASIKADTDYINWLNDIQDHYRFQRPCRLTALREYKMFDQDSTTASQEKQSFVDEVNPVLEKYGFDPSNWTKYSF